jgi:hypothetical protein
MQIQFFFAELRVLVFGHKKKGLITNVGHKALLNIVLKPELVVPL